MTDDLALTQLPQPLARQDTDAVPVPAGDTVIQPPELASRARQRSAVPPVIPPLQVPGYEILEELGRGGMGVVYKARQVRLNRVVALKMILAHGQAEPEALIRFLAEAEAAAAVVHTNVVQVYESGEVNGSPFLAMEFCAGGSLADRLKANGRLAPADAAALVRQVALGVTAAHSQGIIHRDLKPANVLFTESGSRMSDGDAAPTPFTSPRETPGADTDRSTGIPKVTDFGLAKKGPGGDLTVTGAVIGTPRYMAPEQARGDAKAALPATDVWALGVILYECLTGTVPFAGESALSTLRKIADELPSPPRRTVPGIPRDLEAVCLKCLEKNPADRYAGARELADELGRFLAGEPVLGPQSGTWYHVRKAVTRRWKSIASTLLVGAGLFAAWLIPSPLNRDHPVAAAAPDLEQKFAAILGNAELRLLVLEDDEATFDDTYRGQPITAVGLLNPMPIVHTDDLSADEARTLAVQLGAPLEDVELVLTLTREDDQVLTVRQFYGRWPVSEHKPRQIHVPSERYQRIEVRGTATRAGRNVEIHQVWRADMP